MLACLGMFIERQEVLIEAACTPCIGLRLEWGSQLMLAQTRLQLQG
jgi:hypothetical protein